MDKQVSKKQIYALINQLISTYNHDDSDDLSKEELSLFIKELMRQDDLNLSQKSLETLVDCFGENHNGRVGRGELMLIFTKTGLNIK